MLTRIEISDFALIENASIEFNSGLSVLTGETGAGKSILIDAIGSVCGNRVTRDMVRSDKEQSVISAVFDNVSEHLSEDVILEYGIDCEEDSVLLSREILSNGKSYARINGRLVPVSALRTVTSKLLDIHGQHENQAIFGADMQLAMLDRFGGALITNLLNEYTCDYLKLVVIEKELSAFITDDAQKKQLIDLLEYQINEIKNANPIIGEDDELTSRRKIIASAEKIRTALNKSYNLLMGDAEMPALPAIKEASNCISSQLSAFDNYTVISETLNELSYRLEDICQNISNEIEDIDIYPRESKEIDDRLDTLYNLKRKYGGNIAAVIQYYHKAIEKLDNLISGEERLKELSRDKNAIISSLNIKSDTLYNARLRIATELESLIRIELNELGMKGTRFSVKISHSGTDKSFGSDGQDSVEFMISPNIGEEMKPLSRIASGGEASRIMLAIKTILADSDSIQVLIFDEVDTGISGKTAGLLGEKLLKIAKTHQVFCVSHMAQIAAKAQNHIHIEKNVKDGRTHTDIRYVNGADRIKEIARLLSGDENKGEALELAKVMLSGAG